MRLIAVNRIAAIFFLVQLIAGSLQAQGVNFAIGSEKSVGGIHHISALNVESKGKWGVGVFYQAKVDWNYSEEDSNLFRDPYYGITLQAPLAKCEKMSFFVTLRGGLVNKDFVLVVPSLETRIKLFSRFDAVFGMGYRYNYPTASIKVLVNLFKL